MAQPPANPRQPHAHLTAREAPPPTVGTAPARTAAQQGLLGAAAFANANPNPGQGEVDQLAALTAGEQKMMSRKCRLIFFRDQQINETALQQWLYPNLSPNSYEYKAILDFATKMQRNLQARVWSNKDVVRQVIDLGYQHSGLDADGLPVFRVLGLAVRALVFGTAFTPDLVKRLLKPLEQAVDIPNAFAIHHWRVQYQALFITVAETIWSTMNGQLTLLGVEKYDKLQVYANVRDIVDVHFADRPDIDVIPASQLV